MTNWAQVIRRVRAPLVLLGLILVLSALQILGVIPATEQLFVRLEVLFARYGLVLVAIVSFLENLAGLNVYFPGSVVMLTAMALTVGDPVRALVTFLFIFVPSFLAHQVNFFIGRAIGSQSDSGSETRIQQTMVSTRWIWFFTTVWHPHLAAVTSMAAGSSQMSYRKFVGMFGLAFFVWDVIWAIVMYNVGFLIKDVQESNILFPLFLAYSVIWLLWSLWRAISEERKGG